MTDFADDTANALMLAILDEPHRDDIRLVLADRLPEVGEQWCDLAEFVRVGVELARLDREFHENVARIKMPQRIAWGATFLGPVDLRSRERALLERHWPVWLSRTFGVNTVSCLGDLQDFHIVMDGEFRCAFARGFPDLIRCDLRTLFGGTCFCVLQGGEPWPTCPACHGTGTTEGIASAVFWAAPLTRVELVGKRPIQLECDAGNVWNWMPGRPEPQSPWFIGIDLYDLLELPVVEIGGEQMTAKHAPTLADANAALSAAAVKLGRERAHEKPAGLALTARPAGTVPPR